MAPTVLAVNTNVDPSSPLAWSRIAVHGSQSAQFLQGQLSQDVAALDGDGQWSLLLAPDSIVLSACWVTRRADGYGLTVPRELGEVAVARLERFRLRVDCVMSLEPVDEGPFATSRDLIDAGWPGPHEFAARLTPHSFGSTFVRTTISFTKGCFTGQELVARLDVRGSRVPFRLVRATGPSGERINEVLRSSGPDGPQGVTSTAPDGARVVALGIAHRSLLDRPVPVDGDDVVVEAIA